ncbi:hypothetical protein CIL05_16510 [Virgibacillus profundi]|uniref:Uncharacterized protein n=1 Tax=Virgibacillus profundi TaxID=2024555 RepID=A0A2A2IB41_9BACI|nr:hypothetical protein [Virgibacillus profundi]PAV28536.1 hypothetical protein CIL05_16510 [Virgibacillus profundi]PXY52709.1 hypothetical protein CIT14_16655 [Virgibacillus profundi]
MRWKLNILLFCTILLAACTDQEYEKEDVVAILNGDEIKIKEILWQYSLDEDPENSIYNYLKQEIVILEAEDSGITVSKEEIEEKKQLVYPNSDPVERFEVIEEQEFYEKQASLFDVSPEEYYEIWEDNTYTKQLYVEKYIDEIIGEPSDDFETWGQEVDEHINNLFEEYKEDKKLIIKY